MDPLERKIELMRAGISQASIARKAKVSTAHVARVIAGLSTSERVEKMIAKAIDKPWKTVFPRRHQNDSAQNLEKRLAS